MDERELRSILVTIRTHTTVAAYALVLIAICAVAGLAVAVTA